MTKKQIIRNLDKQFLKSDVPHFSVGDTIRVHTRIIEGDKERVQMFTGTVIARKGTGVAATFTLHRVAYGEGMERIFLLHSPRISNIEILKEGDVRRGKLYYLRGTSGKKAKVKSKVPGARRRGLSNNGDKAPEAIVGEEEEKEVIDVAAEITETTKVESGNDSAAVEAKNDKPAEPETEKADA